MSTVRTSFLVLAVLVMLFIAGPRIQTSTDWTEIADLPAIEELDGWLSEQESRVDNLQQAKQKRVVWAGASGEKTTFSVVYLHGFSASNLETAPYPDSVAAALGANLFYTRIAGHGRNGDALGRSTAEDWIASTVEAIRIGELIGDRIILIGTSTGATLAAWAATESDLARNAEAQVWISPNFAPANPKSRMLLWPWGRVLLKLIQGDTYSWEAQNEQHAAIGEQSYGSEALLHVMGLVETVSHLSFDTIHTPVLMVYSPTDTVIDQDVSIDLWNDLGSARKDSMVVLRARDANNHVLVGDAMGPENTIPVLRRTLEFLNEQ